MRLVHLYVMGAFRPALAAYRGRTKTHVVVNSPTGLKAIKVSNREADKAREVTLKGKPYPIQRALKHLRRVKRERGSTKAAAKLLRGAA